MSLQVLRTCSPSIHWLEWCPLWVFLSDKKFVISRVNSSETHPEPSLGRESLLLEFVGLVADLHHALHERVRESQLPQDLQDLQPLRLGVRVTDVPDVDDDILEGEEANRR